MSDSLLLNARDAARLCGVSPATWHRLTSAGKNPPSLKIGGSVRWRRSDISSWIDAGCPDRRTWLVLVAEGGGR